MADTPPRRTFAEFLTALLGGCLDHRHEQVGRCVYCVTCNRRLYEGPVLDPDDLAAIKEYLALAASDPGGWT